MNKTNITHGKQSIKDLKPEDDGDSVVDAKEGKFGSVLVGDTFVWKKYDEDKLANAVNAFIYWNNLKKEDYSNFFKVDKRIVEKAITTFKKKLELVSRKYKLDVGIELYYDKKQGKWYNGNLHFVDYLWDDVCDIVKQKHGNWLKRSFFLVDDVYVLSAMRFKKLSIQHHIVKSDDKDSKLLHKKAIAEAAALTKAEIPEIKKISKYNENKSLEIIFN